MSNELSVEKAIDVLYTIRAYYASMTAGYPKGKDCIGIGDVMCSEIANSCLMAIKALESQRWIPVTERLPEEKIKPITEDFYEYQCTLKIGDYYDVRSYKFGDGHWWFDGCLMDGYVTAWMPIPQPYKEEGSDK